ncbi:MAG TPA: SRPBCC family protein [Dongiaceae bacterium]|nr:SRPBCC family protein [Dongiaceae bacterium]
MKKVLAVVVVILLVLLAVVSSRPATYHIERSATLAGTPEAIYTHLADFHQWDAWSPWARIDPRMKTSFSGAASGAGAVYEWTGNDKVGQGRMTILDAQPGSRVTIRLEFIKPFASTCTTGFTLAPEGSGTKVTWTMDGRNNFMGKAFSLVMNMDKTIGGDFERGLHQLGSAAASNPSMPADSSAAKASTPS